MWRASMFTRTVNVKFFTFLPCLSRWHSKSPFGEWAKDFNRTACINKKGWNESAFLHSIKGQIYRHKNIRTDVTCASHRCVSVVTHQNWRTHPSVKPNLTLIISDSDRTQSSLKMWDEPAWISQHLPNFCSFIIDICWFIVYLSMTLLFFCFGYKTS